MPRKSRVAARRGDAAERRSTRALGRGLASLMLGEWLVADGLGGYAMGTRDGIRTRRYHSLLLVAALDSERRFNLVNGLEAWLDTPDGAVALSSHRYVPDAVHPDGASRL